MFNRKLVFGAACMGMLLFGIGLITLGSVATDLRSKFSMDDIAAGKVFSILPLGILIGSLLFGPICDKYGYKLLLTTSCLLMCVGFSGLAYAPDQGLLSLCIFFFGLGGGAINGATNAMVTDISQKNKAADLSILGVYFGVGALGMPAVLGILKSHLDFDRILAIVGAFTFFIALFFFIIRYPDPKHRQGFPIKQSALLFRDKLLFLIAFFLFFQSSLEAILNNWTTSYLTSRLSVNASQALYSLSLLVAGMAFMRLLTGSLFRRMDGVKLLFASFAMMIAGLILLKTATFLLVARIGLVLIGMGLAGGFPIMLGIVGGRYAALSGTAFSFVLVIALLGNMLINYGMGFIAQHFGIQHLVHVAMIELLIMTVLCFFIQKQIKFK